MPEGHNDEGLPTHLTGARVVIRAPLAGELESLAERIARDPEASPWWGTDTDAVRRDLLGDPDYHVLVIEVEDTAAGVIAYEEELHPDYHSASVDITLLGGFVGRGLGGEALRLLIGWLVRERGHHRITIDPAVANTRAQRAYERAGFRPVGVMRRYERGPDGVWHNNLLMELLAEELED